jgi:class 3 adenylate cyclase
VEVPAPLVPVVEALDATGWAVEVCDPAWRLVWGSSEMRAVLGNATDAELGLGQHMIQTRHANKRLSAISPESGERWLRLHAPFVMYDTGATREDIRRLADPDYAHVIGDLEPRKAPPRWSFAVEFEGIGTIRGLGERVCGDGGELLGIAFLYGSALPASILAYVASGSLQQFERMSRLIEPRRREAAVLFADVEGSTDRSRRLPSPRYFAAIRDLNNAIDDTILEQGGIVGKHAGDGVSAFFLAEQLGSASAAARAAITAARGIAAAAAAQEGEWRVNIGVHWGGTLYMGQIATSGRLEITALGDEVNECARIQEAASSGQALASKMLLERLDPADGEAVGIDPVTVVYRLVCELPGASEKARRDAGLLPVSVLSTG